MQTLKIGVSGNDVIKLQILLNGYLGAGLKLKNDGHFGKRTEDAVISFQKKKNLVSDGIVGTKTWGALLGNTEMNIQPRSNTETVRNAPWYDIAQAEMGVKEILGANQNNHRILEYHATTTLGAKTDEVPWCSSFVNWVMKQAGIEGTNNALAKSWLDWGTGVSTPIKGDVVVIKRINKDSDEHTGSSTGYHVGFYVTSNNLVISLLGGNQGNSVKKSNFLLRSYEVVGYRRPVSAMLGVPLNTSSMLARMV